MITETDVNNSNNDGPALAEKGVKTNLSSLLIALIVVCTVAFLLVVFLIVAILIKRRMNTNVAPNVVAHNKNDEDDGNEFDQMVVMDSQDADEFNNPLYESKMNDENDPFDDQDDNDII